MYTWRGYHFKSYCRDIIKFLLMLQFWNSCIINNSLYVLVIPRRWNREGDIVLALSVRPSVLPSVRPNFVSALLLCNYWLEFNEPSWESSISRGDEHIVGLLQSDPLTQSYGPWLVMQYAYRVKIVSALLLCNYWLEFNETLWESSIPRGGAHIVTLFFSDTLTQSYGPWLVMQYAYRAKIVSALLLCNYWLEFNETLWELSIQRGDAHIIALFRSDTLLRGLALDLLCSIHIEQ
jgi:glycerol-3-phosphate cytidylyltransferase-like family protein